MTSVAIVAVSCLYWAAGCAYNEMPFLADPKVARRIISVLALLGIAAFAARSSVPLIMLLTTLVALVYGSPMLPFRPRATIHTSSDITSRMNKALPPGMRYALVGPNNLLPPNMESLVRLRSVNTYNSLSSVNYQDYISHLGGQTNTYGRHMHYIDSGFLSDNPAFSYSGIELILSSKTIVDPGLRLVQKAGDMNFYKPLRKPILYAQIIAYKEESPGRFLLDGYLYDRPSLKVIRLREQDDYQKYQVPRSQFPTLLFISQQFHLSWRALTDKGPAEVGVVNSFFTGVRVPAGANWLEMEFRSYVYWSFIPQLFFVCVGTAFVARKIMLRGNHEGQRDAQDGSSQVVDSVDEN